MSKIVFENLYGAFTVKDIGWKAEFITKPFSQIALFFWIKREGGQQKDYKAYRYYFFHIALIGQKVVKNDRK